jgi:uncharacterized repeat protein (TIGR03837 family)
MDDTRPLQWMALPADLGKVTVLPWDASAHRFEARPNGVVIEAFGCELPDEVKARMAGAAPTPQWINLEYLSAEDYVERSHGLRSPVMSGPGAGMDKWFFYPGFTPSTGGLLREPGVVEHLDGRDALGTLAGLGALPRPDERVVSLFCYDDAPLDTLAAWLSDRPTLLLTTPGHATRQADTASWPDTVRRHALPWLTQAAYDHLLAACDLNLVRGEDSFVRAQWAGRPFLWHIYPQHDGVHGDKLDAFLDRMLDGEPPAIAQALRGAFRAWNRLSPAPTTGLPAQADWAALAGRWRARLLTQVDLTSQLLAFVAERR